jgi:hypothetical protein
VVALLVLFQALDAPCDIDELQSLSVLPRESKNPPFIFLCLLGIYILQKEINI